MRNKLFSVLTLTLAVAGAFAQQPAPRETVTAKIGGKQVSIEYGRPSLKGRSFADLTKDLPEDRMWRAGSEQITTLTTETDLMIGGKAVPAGKYSLYVYCPESGDYALAVNKVLGQPLGKIWAAAPAQLANEPWPHFEYQKEIGDMEVARIPLKSEEGGETVDLFTVTLAPHGAAAVLKLAWGTSAWSTEVKAASEGSHSH